MAPDLPILTFLTSDASFTDYRPTVNPAGNTVIFERTPVAGGATTLFMIDDLDDPEPVPFLSGSPPTSQTRPDWCWSTGQVLFNGADSNSAPVSVWQVGGNGANPKPISGTTGAFYPKWNLRGDAFVTENSGAAASPRPCNTVFNLQGIPLAGNVNGKIPAGWIPTFGGMPAVMAGGLPRIAYAGEPMITDWNGPNSGLQYNENNNYIFLNESTPNGFTTMPMESGTSVQAFDAAHEGRAPDVSPDGNLVVFESSRPPGGPQTYAIYLFNLKTSTLTQVTDPSLNGQHAKFFPDGSRLIVTIHHPNNDPPTRGIAWIDISSLL